MLTARVKHFNAFTSNNELEIQNTQNTLYNTKPDTKLIKTSMINTGYTVYFDEHENINKNILYQIYSGKNYTFDKFQRCVRCDIPISNIMKFIEEYKNIIISIRIHRNVLTFKNSSSQENSSSHFEIAPKIISEIEDYIDPKTGIANFEIKYFNQENGRMDYHLVYNIHTVNQKNAIAEMRIMVSPELFISNETTYLTERMYTNFYEWIKTDGALSSQDYIKMDGYDIVIE